MDAGEPSALANGAGGGLWRRGHDDGVRGGAPASLYALRWLTKYCQRAREEAVGRWGASGATAVKNGWLGASLRGYGDGGGGASSLQRCGEEEGREKRKEGAGRLGLVLAGLRPRPGASWPA